MFQTYVRSDKCELGTSEVAGEMDRGTCFRCCRQRFMCACGVDGKFPIGDISLYRTEICRVGCWKLPTSM
jgi:hypothetical protein